MTSESQPTSIGLVVFDWAGTLIDHGSCAPAAVFVQAFAKHGVTITMQQARGPMGMAKRDHIRSIADEPDIAEAWRQQHGRAFTEDDINAIYAAFLPLQMACLKDYCGVIDGVADTVEALRGRGVRIGSSTGYTTELMEVVMAEAERQGLRVEAMRCASTVSPGRPAPWMIYDNAHELGVYPMRRVVKVDDTVTGIEAGRNAGCWAVGVSRTGNLVGMNKADLAALPVEEQRARIDAAAQRLTDAGAHAVVESAADLLPFVEAIESCLTEGALPDTCAAIG